MSPTDSFAAWLSRLHAGDEEAYQELFRRFAGQLVLLAHRHMSAALRQKLDREDILQSVLASLVLSLRDGRLTPVNWDNLWGLLVVITLRKCSHCTERFHAACRNIDQEVPLVARLEETQTAILPTPQPTPLQAANAGGDERRAAPRPGRMGTRSGAAALAGLHRV